MKKITLITIGIIFIGFLYFFFFKNNIEIDKPFDHPLFVSEEELLAFGNNKYHYMKNIEETYPNNATTIYYSIILPKKNGASPTNAIQIIVHDFKDSKNAKEYKEKMETGMKGIDIENYPIYDYKKLGEQNKLITIFDEDQFISYIRILEKNYVIEIQSDSLENLDKAKEQLTIFAELMLKKVSDESTQDSSGAVDGN